MIKDILENISSFKIYLPKIVGTDISNAILNFPSCAAYVAYSVGCAAYSVAVIFAVGCAVYMHQNIAYSGKLLLLSLVQVQNQSFGPKQKAFQRVLGFVWGQDSVCRLQIDQRVITLNLCPLPKSF